jgi:hypothetical protein
MKYEEAIKEAIDHFGDAVVMTGGSDDWIIDHYNEIEPLPDEEEEWDVAIEEDVLHFGPMPQCWILWRIGDDDLVDGPEPLARIVSMEDYEQLGRS